MTQNRVETVRIFGGETAVGKYVAAAFEGYAGEAVCVFCPPQERFDEELDRAAEYIADGRPANVLVISSDEVYTSADERRYENSRISPDTVHGRQCEKAERILGESCRRTGSVLTVLRPAMMFGTGIGGATMDMFRLVTSGKYFTVRDFKGLRSVVCALDVARVARQIAGTPGVFNVADPTPRTLHELADAMSANTGECKRTPVLVRKLAAIVARLADRIPSLRPMWGSEALKEKLTDRILDTTELTRVLPDYKFYDTVAVISRSDPNYPYQQQ